MSSRRSGTTTPPARALRRPRRTSRTGLRRVPIAPPRLVAGTPPARHRTMAAPAVVQAGIRRAPGRRRVLPSRLVRRAMLLGGTTRSLAGSPRLSLAVSPRLSLAGSPRLSLAVLPSAHRDALPREACPPRVDSVPRQAVPPGAAVVGVAPSRTSSRRRAGLAGSSRTTPSRRRRLRRRCRPRPPITPGRRRGDWRLLSRRQAPGADLDHARPRHRPAEPSSSPPVVLSSRRRAGAPGRRRPLRSRRNRPPGRVGAWSLGRSGLTRTRGRGLRR
ncbi:hypothetical protein UA75_00100 [Actinoalloteichus sp. GBA129-24]|nr:hypothetical protein UA75_00100 [Actinoalloteichus sp. GBA129-24]